MPVTLRERILDLLRQRHPDGLDDDKIAEELSLPQRQQANARCRELEREGLIERHRLGGKLHNFWIAAPNTPNATRSQSGSQESPAKAWHWEGNVQAHVIHHLQQDGFDILSAADTAARERGKDIVAAGPEGEVWVTVKGYPEPTKKTPPSTQAGHWFKQAVFDILEYRGERQDVAFAIALPDFPRYRNLAKRIEWLRDPLPFLYFWVDSQGRVIEDRP